MTARAPRAEASGEVCDARSLAGKRAQTAQRWLADHGDWLEERRALLFAELAAALGDEVADSSPPLDVVTRGEAARWPVEIVGFWVALCRSRGSTWAEIGAASGVSGLAARRRYGEWVAPFKRAGISERRPSAMLGRRLAAVPERQAGAGIGNLPATTTSFIGRDDETADVRALLEEHRLVTVTGAPGIGKSRLALEAGRRWASARAGTWLVDLELVPASSPDALVLAVADALAVAAQPGQTSHAAIIGHLHQRRLLLVLDNCEHLLRGCAELVHSLLACCPDLTILATSQEPLRVHGERVWVVDGLPVPAHGADRDGIASTAAVVLFRERARAWRPGFELVGETARTVADICRRLDGSPLAIEIAASRLCSLSLAELFVLLDDPFDALVAVTQSARASHRSLRAAFDAAHDRLGVSERALLRRLSIFVGSPTRLAVEAVCAGDLEAGRSVLEVLDLLVAKSWVIAEATGSHARFRLSGTVRGYGMARLAAAGEEADIRQRHARWCVELAERLEPELTGSDQPGCLRELDQECSEVLAALSWTTANDGDAALRLAGALALYWRMRGCFADGWSWLEAALGAGAGVGDLVRAKALWGAGFMAVMLGQLEPARARLEASLAIYRESGDDAGSARSLLLLGNLSQYDADSATAASLFEEAALVARRAGDSWCFAHAVALLAKSLMDQGDADAARPLLEHCLEVAHMTGDAQSLRIGLFLLGNLVMDRGEQELAEDLLGEGLDVTRELGEEHGTAGALTSLGKLAIVRGDFERARHLIEEGVVRAESSCDPLTVTSALCALADLNAAMGDSAVARAQFAEVATRARQIGGTCDSASLGLARTALADGQPATARPLLYQVLVAARTRGDRAMESDALEELATLSRDEGDLRRSATLNRQALTLRHATGDLARVAGSLDELAIVAVSLGSAEHGTRLFGAAQAIRDVHDVARPAAHEQTYEAALLHLRSVLSEHEIDAAWAHGATMTVQDAVRCACLGRGGSHSLGGWASLTPAEHKVALLAAEGLSNKEIAGRLFLSRHTVAAHLTSVYPKLGIHSRTELAREQ